MSLSKLEKTAALQILAYLLKKQTASRTDLRKNIEATLDTIYTTLSVLSKLSLIKEESREMFPFRIEVSLTDKGRAVAERLVEIEKILEAEP